MTGSGLVAGDRPAARRRKSAIAVVWVASCLLALDLGRALAAGPLEPFFGSYVGSARVEDLETGETQRRDMDIVIQPYDDDGFRLHWVNVTLIDGKRAVPGVERRVQTVLFEPAEGRELYVEAQESNPFQERQTMEPMHGDAVRWAAVEGKQLHVYSFVVLADGRYELQTYDRILTDGGLDIRFERIVDGRVVKRITGTTVRADVKAAEG